MKLQSALSVVLLGSFIACASPSLRTEPGSVLSEVSGLEEVTIVSKGLE